MSPSKEALLIIEDEESIAEGLQFNFEREGFDVFLASDGRSGINLIRDSEHPIHLVVLDLMLPELDGFEVLRQTRTWAEGLPILVLSARSSEADRIKALELGADDFVAKPFSLQELLLRVRSLLKRSSWIRQQGWVQGGESSAVSFATGSFSPETLTFSSQLGQKTRLSPTEAALLLAFAAKPNIIQSRQQLLQQVWHYEPGTATRTVDVFVSKLRKIVETNDRKPEFVLSIRGAGYAYVTDAGMRRTLGADSELGEQKPKK